MRKNESAKVERCLRELGVRLHVVNAGHQVSTTFHYILQYLQEHITAMHLLQTPFDL